MGAGCAPVGREDNDTISSIDGDGRRNRAGAKSVAAPSMSGASTPILEALSRELDEADDDARAKLAAQLAPYIAPATRELLDATAAARRLGLNPDTVVRMAREGRLLAVKAGRAWRFPADRLVVRPPAARPPFSAGAARGGRGKRARARPSIAAIRGAKRRCT